MKLRLLGPKFRVKRQPDFERFRHHLTRQSSPGPVPIAEMFADWPIIERVTGEKFPFTQADFGLNRANLKGSRWVEVAKRIVDLRLRFCYEVGFDYLYIDADLGLRRTNFTVSVDETARGRKRWWVDETTGPIQNWEDFERYPWPKPQDLDHTMLDYANLVIPDGMKILVEMGGIFEESSWLMGLTNFSLALYDQLDLVEAIVGCVGDLAASLVENAMQRTQVGGIWLGDDLGFNTGTLISPEAIRQYILPQHKRLIDLTHQYDGIFILHSCGNLERIMDDIIDLGIDAKHSFEDKIMPVEEICRRWGDQVGIVGGLDMDLMARGSEEEVRYRTREILDVCGPRGGYALGTGNSVADYIPVRNFLAMLDEGRRWNEEHFRM